MIARFFAPVLTVLVLALPAAPAKADFIDIQRVVSPGGIEAWLVQDNTIPFLALEMWFSGGASLDTEETLGAVNMMMGLLEEGTGDLDAQDFAAAQEGLAATFGFDTYRDEVSVSAQVLTQNREEALALLRAAIVAPSFDEVAVNRVRQQVLAGIESDLTDPQSIAGAAFREMAYGGHPYAFPLEGTLETVTALTRDDLVTAHRNVLTRDRVAVGVAGDITPEELGPLLDTLLGDLPEADTPLAGPAEVALAGGTTVIDLPIPQSTVLFGHSGIRRDDPDFFAAFVMNQILGAGGYRSRLMNEVREERGLTYGISTWLSLARSAPMMQGAFSSSNDLVGEAIDVIRAEWADLAQNGVTAEELAAAQRYMTGAYPLRFDGNSRIAGILAAMQSDNMPIDYINTRNARVEAVTLEDIQRVAQRMVDSDGLHFVIVGQPDGLETN